MSLRVFPFDSQGYGPHSANERIHRAVDEQVLLPMGIADPHVSQAERWARRCYVILTGYACPLRRWK